MRSLLNRTALLFGIVVCLLGGCVAISKQMAQSGSNSVRIWTDQPQSAVRLPFGENQVWSMPIALPAPPFTIEAVARFSIASSESANWGVLLNVYSTQPSAVFLTNDRHYFAPGSHLPAYFYRLHAAGQFNQVTLTVNANNQAVLSLNGQIVWNAPLFFDRIHSQWALFAANSYRRAAVITWLHIALYQP